MTICPDVYMSVYVFLASSISKSSLTYVSNIPNTSPIYPLKIFYISLIIPKWLEFCVSM